MHSHRGVAQLLEASRGFWWRILGIWSGCTREEFLELPLVGVQTLLASDELNVRDELTAFHAMVEWLRHHHDDLDDRKCVDCASLPPLSHSPTHTLYLPLLPL
ncbi:hypothetical protein CLOP_g6272, partial [Closterium sp. NIES-67]